MPTTTISPVLIVSGEVGENVRLQNGDVQLLVQRADVADLIRALYVRLGRCGEPYPYPGVHATFVCCRPRGHQPDRHSFAPPGYLKMPGLPF